MMLKYSIFGSKVSFILFAVFAIPSIIKAKIILEIWLKVVPNWTVVFFQYQLIRTLLEQVTITLGTAISAVGKIKGLNITSFASNVMPMVCLYYLFEAGFSPYWFNWVIIFFMVIVSTFVKVYFCVIKCGLRLNYFLISVIIPVLATIVLTFGIGFLSTSLSISNNLSLIMCFISTTLTLLASSLFLFDKREKKELLSIQKKIKRKWKMELV